MNVNYNLTLDIPDGLENMSVSDIVNWLNANNRIKSTERFNSQQISNILRNIFARVGIEPDKEQMIFLLDDSSRLLCEASAGSGKTTISQLKMIKYKLLYGIDGSDILAIAYNDHAADDMLRRHQRLVEEINTQRISGVSLNSRIVCRTFHSNALAWVKEYAKLCGIADKENMIISDYNESKFMQKALDSALKAANSKRSQKDEIRQKPSMVPSLIAFNSYIEEKMLPINDCLDLSKFKEIGLDIGVVNDVIGKFNKMCEFNSMFTFSRILVMFYNLLKDHEDVRVRIQNAYKVLLVDEYQDMSPLMNEILFLMINEKTVFNAIGDGDQSIYSFKGTDSLNCLKFKGYFENGKVISMGANRRCRKEIVDSARKILSINKLRYPKKIYSTKEGGLVRLVPYETAYDEYNGVIDELDGVEVSELYNYCIAYRNKESSLLLSKMLLDRRIPFVVKSGYEPYKDSMSASLHDIFAMLKQPRSAGYQKSALYRVTPATKSQVVKLIDSSVNNGEMMHYLEYDWDSLGNISDKIYQALTILKECEDALRSGALMCNFFAKVYRLFTMYYWNFVREQTKFPVNLEESIISDYTDEITYEQFMKRYNDKIDIRDRFSKSGVGVRLTTFHGLKGLEFDKVFLVDMTEDVFPNYSKIEKECKDNEEEEIMQKEECVRLFYVACTRPRNELVVCYSKDSPSIYIDLIASSAREKLERCRSESINKSSDVSDISLDIDDFELEEDNSFGSEDDDSFGDLELEEDLTFDNSSNMSQDSELDNSECEQEIVVEDFQIPDDNDDVTIDIGFNTNEDIVLDVLTNSINTDANIEEVSESKKIPIADHDMYMYHEPSDSYYIIKKGEACYQGSSIDFESSMEITDVEYNNALSIDNSTIRSDDKSKLEQTIGILDFLSD